MFYLKLETITKAVSSLFLFPPKKLIQLQITSNFFFSKENTSKVRLVSYFTVAGCPCFQCRIC